MKIIKKTKQAQLLLYAAQYERQAQQPAKEANMTIQRFGTPTTPGARPCSKAVAADGWLYVSGQVPRDADGEIVSGSISVQARVTLDNLKKVLELAGYTLNDVVRVTVYLDDPRDFAGFNKIYAQYFTAEHAPARVCVQASMMSDLRVEVDCVAYRKP